MMTRLIAALTDRNAPSSALRNLTTSISLCAGGVGKTLENLGNERWIDCLVGPTPPVIMMHVPETFSLLS